MPFHFKTNEDISEYSQFKSVLIIPCRFCPAASLSVSNNEPYFQVFRNFLKTASYQQYIKNLKSNLEKEGIRTKVFESTLIHQFVLCMWTTKRREKLAKIAKEYEALIVLGCEAAVQTVTDSVKSTSCKVLQGIETEGVMSIKPHFNFPLNISLELQSLTPLSLEAEQSN